MRGIIFSIAWTCALSAGLAAENSALDRASTLYNHTDYRGAVEVLQRAPQDAKTFQLMGQAYLMEADFKRATEALEKAVALNTKSSDAHLWLGRAYGRRAETSFAFSALGYATKAREALEKAVELQPSNLEAVNDLLEFYVQAPGIIGGGVDKARKLVTLLEKRDKAESHFAKARLAEHRRDYTAAEANLRTAVELAPGDPGRLIDLAKFLARRSRFEESDRTFQAAERISPSSPAILYARAEAYIESKRNFDKARDLLKKYLASDDLTPDDPPRYEAMKLLKRAEGS